MKKRSIEITALVLLLVMLGVCLASCIGGLLNGTYSDIEGEISEGFGEVLEFKGIGVNVKTCVYGEAISEFSGTYSVKDGQLTIYSSEPFVGGVLDMSTGKYFCTYDFEEGDGFIKLDDTVFYKK